MSYQQRYQRWLQAELDPDLAVTLRSWHDEALIADAFSRDLEFGTAGLRGVLGPGPNRMNRYVVRKASAVFALYLLRYLPEAASRGVVIAHDNRRYSDVFSDEAAHVLASYGIRVYLFDGLRPTPELSFAVRHLKAAGGIVITASHNPKEYNGYKVYDADGCQLLPDQIERIVALYDEVDDELSITYETRFTAPYLYVLGPEVDEAYWQEVYAIRRQPQLDASHFPIVYSPQHGTGLVGVQTLLQRAGFPLHIVAEQALPDPDFSGTLSPNPEEKVAYTKALELAGKVQASLVLTTDPDADRVGVAERLKDGRVTYFTGNQMGALLLSYLLEQAKKQHVSLRHQVVFDTIVTGRLGRTIARAYGVQVEATLTGFKYIGKKIAGLEAAALEGAEDEFFFGYEESYGFLLAPFTRDKDALQASLMIAEMALDHAQKGRSLTEALQSLYQRYGYHYEEVRSLALPGLDGLTRLHTMMKTLRQARFTTLGALAVVRREDYQTLRYELANGQEGELDFPASDVLRYELEDGSVLAIRPSGTEPKCKFYYNLVGQSLEDAKTKLQRIADSIAPYIQ